MAIFITILFSFNAFSTEITLWSAHESLKDLKNITAMFEKETGHKVNVNVYVMEAMRSELLRNANRKTFPDISLVPADFLGLYKELNFRPLDNSWGLKKINKTALQSVHLNGNHYGLPILVGNHLLLYYNKSLIEQPAKSWDQFQAQYQQKFENQNKKILAWNYDSIYRFSSFLQSYNAWPLKENKVLLATPEMVQALTSYQAKNKLDFVVQNCDSQCSVNKMINEEVAYTISGDWEHKNLYAGLKDKLGIAPLPMLDGNTMTSLSTSFALAVPLHPRNDKVAAVVKKFVAFMARDDMQELFFNSYKLLPANQFVLKKIQQQANGNSKVIIEQFINSFPMPSEYNMSIIWSILRLGYRDLTEQDFTPKEVSLRMQKRADKALGNARDKGSE